MLFFGLHPKFWTKIFCIRRELENRDSDKSHKIWAKLYSPKFFSGGTATLSMNDVNKTGVSNLLLVVGQIFLCKCISGHNCCSDQSDVLMRVSSKILRYGRLRPDFLISVSKTGVL